MDDGGVLGDRCERALIAGQQGGNLVRVGGAVSGEQPGADCCELTRKVDEDPAGVGDGFGQDGGLAGGQARPPAMQRPVDKLGDEAAVQDHPAGLAEPD